MSLKETAGGVHPKLGSWPILVRGVAPENRVREDRRAVLVDDDGAGAVEAVRAVVDQHLAGAVAATADRRRVLAEDAVDHRPGAVQHHAAAVKARLVAAEDAVGDRGGPVAVHHAATAVGHDVSRELAAHDRQVALDLVDTASGEGLVVLEHAVGHGDDAGAADLHAPADVAVVAREQAAVEPHRTVLHVDGTAAEPRPR
jgi:hypothetical protein